MAASIRNIGKEMMRHCFRKTRAQNKCDRELRARVEYISAQIEKQLAANGY